MFTGIIEEQGVIEKIREKENLVTLVIKAKKTLIGTKIGDSIAVDGICLTVTAKSKAGLTFAAMKETITKTTLGRFRIKQKVNLERALRASDRLGGHFVTGHVDGVGLIKGKTSLANYVEYRIRVDRALLRYMVPKGAVCVDGISLTAGNVTGQDFTVYLIAHTLKVTTLGVKNKGDEVNIETDILAKYVKS